MVSSKSENKTVTKNVFLLKWIVDFFGVDEGTYGSSAALNNQIVIDKSTNVNDKQSRPTKLQTVRHIHGRQNYVYGR